MPTTFTATSLPKRATLWADESIKTAGNNFTHVFDGNQIHAAYSYQNASANGDTFTQSVFLRAGTYTPEILAVKEANGGILKVQLDGVDVMTNLDFYAASTTYNVAFGAAQPFTIPTDGYHKLTFVVTGRNGSSGGWNIKWTKMDLKQAAD